MRRLLEFISDPTSGKFSESKVFLIIAKAAYVFAFIHMTLDDHMDSALLLAFAIPLMSHELLARMVNFKIGAGQAEGAVAPTPTAKTLEDKESSK